jgi:hypothetical protein
MYVTAATIRVALDHPHNRHGQMVEYFRMNNRPACEPWEID